MAFNDKSGFGETLLVSAGSEPVDPLGWRCVTRVDKWNEADLGGAPYETLTHVGNLRLIGGASLFWERAITKVPSGSATGAALQALSSDNAVIGVSSGTGAAAKTQTALQTTGTKFYSSMTTGWPAHTDGTSSSGQQDCVFKASFGTTKANVAWREWAVANSSGGRHINRAVSNLGTKATGTWTITVTLTETT